MYLVGSIFKNLCWTGYMRTDIIIYVTQIIYFIGENFRHLAKILIIDLRARGTANLSFAAPVVVAAAAAIITVYQVLKLVYIANMNSTNLHI